MTQPFQLPQTTECQCDHVNIREENHGEDKVLAVDLSFSKTGGNELLDLFHPDIRTTLYWNREAQQGQNVLPDVLAILPNLRLSGLPETLRWGGADKHGGYRLILDYGLGDAQGNVDLTSCVVGKKWFSCMEGGTVTVGWRVSYAGEALQDVMTRGKLTGLKGQKAFIQLHAPAVLQVIKGGKSKPAAAPSDGGGDLLDEGDGEGEDEDTPEKAMQRAHGATTH